MKRRQAITAAAFGLGSAALAACGGRRETPNQGTSLVAGGRRPRVRWRMATSWPESLDIIYGGAVTIAELCHRSNIRRSIPWTVQSKPFNNAEP